MMVVVERGRRGRGCGKGDCSSPVVDSDMGEHDDSGMKERGSPRSAMAGGTDWGRFVYGDVVYIVVVISVKTFCGWWPLDIDNERDGWVDLAEGDFG